MTWRRSFRSIRWSKSEADVSYRKTRHRGTLYNMTKRTPAEAGAMKGKCSGQNVQSSAEAIAKEHDVGDVARIRAHFLRCLVSGASLLFLLWNYFPGCVVVLSRQPSLLS